MAHDPDLQNRTAPSSPVDRFLASAPSAPRAVDRRADVRVAMLGGRASRPADVVVREAQGRDAAAIARLAEVDGGRIPAAPVLIAERSGVPVAAIGVLDRRVLADPFADADAAIHRLQAVAAELRGPERRRRITARLRGGTGRRGRSAGAPRDGLPGAVR